MTTTTDTIRKSTIVLSWPSTIFKIDGVEYSGFQAMSFEEKLERKLVHANQRDARPVGMTRGKYSISAVSLTVLKSTAATMRKNLAAKSGVGSHGAAEFTLEEQHVEPNQDVVAKRVVGCRLGGNKHDDKEGTDELTETVEIMAMSAVHSVNGEESTLYTDTEAA